MIAESVRHALSDPGHSHLPLCPDYEGDSPKGEPLELRFPVKTDIVMDKPPALAVGCMTPVSQHGTRSVMMRQLRRSVTIRLLRSKIRIRAGENPEKNLFDKKMFYVAGPIWAGFKVSDILPPPARLRYLEAGDLC